MRDKALDLPPGGLRTDIFQDARSVAAAAGASSFIDPPAFLKRLDALEAGFAVDMGRARALESLLFDADDSGYPEGAARLFSAWHEGRDPISMPALTVVALEQFGVPEGSAHDRAALMAAVLGEYPNGLQYHGNLHYRKVLCHTIRMIATHNAYYAGTDGMLSPRAAALFLAAAGVHDLGHQGGDNQREGVYTPGYMEQLAIEIARPFLVAAGLDRDDVAAIEAMVFCTDITFFAGDNSPAVRLKKIFRHHFWGDEAEDVETMTMGRLRPFGRDSSLVLAAMMLHEADVATSAGLTYEQTVRETIDIMEERGATSAGPAVVLHFLREQLGETFFTQAGRQLFGRAMTDIIARAEADIARGRDRF